MKVLREGPVKITKATVDGAWRRRAKDRRIVVGDTVCRGLALVVNSASMAWTYSYKPRGLDPVTGKRFSSRSVTLGNPQTHSPDEARDTAGALKGRTKGGADPAAERKARIAVDAERRGTTLDRLLEEYARVVPNRTKLRGAGTISAKHAAEEVSHARAAVSAMRAGGKPVSEVGAADLRLLLRADPERPNAARHRFGAISRFFDWALDEGLLRANPCGTIAKARRPKAPASRVHHLRPEELGGLWRAADAVDPVRRDLVRFLIAVPCRRGEAGRMGWEHVDLQTGIWSQPGKMTKNRDPHRLHLHPLALGILRARYEAMGRPKAGLVFPGPRSGKPLDGFTKLKASLDRASGLTAWRLHDFRRSFATALGEAGTPEPVADAVLNHRQAATRGGVLGVYQRAQRWPEQVAAMEAWGKVLAAALARHEPTTEVVLPNRRRKGGR